MRVAFSRPLWLSYIVAVAPPLLIAAALGFGFGALADEVVDEDAVVEIDRELAAAIRGRGSSAQTDLWTAVTTVGGLVGMGVTTAAVAGALWRRSRLQAVFVASCYIAALMMVAALKLGFGRERPVFVEPLALETTPSFPSGHATVSIAVAGALCFLFARRQRSLRMQAGAVGAAAAVVLAIGFSRLYLGVHYLSDVLAGWLAGGTVVALAAGTLVAFEHRRARASIRREGEA